MITYIDKVVNMVKEQAHIKNNDLAHMYALLVLVKGENITLEDVHDAWAMNMNYRPQTPYCYGHEHHSIVPFDELSVECQSKDQQYVNTLIAIARSLKF